VDLGRQGDRFVQQTLFLGDLFAHDPILPNPAALATPSNLYDINIIRRKAGRGLCGLGCGSR
jgi:hypothetical protein